MADTKIEWKEVPTHRGYYVNNIGMIFGPSGKILRPMQQKSGHLYIIVPPPIRPRKLFIHRAMLLAFVGLPENGQETRHLNGNPKDNRLGNLVWGTKIEQRNDERIHGTLCMGEKKGTAKLREFQVLQIRKRIKSEPSRKLAKEYGVSHTTVLKAANGKKWKYLSGGQNGNL